MKFAWMLGLAAVFGLNAGMGFSMLTFGTFGLALVHFSIAALAFGLWMQLIGETLNGEDDA